jgi:hypothetical protein
MAVVQSEDKMNIIMPTPPPCRQGSEFFQILSPTTLITFIHLSLLQYASTIILHEPKKEC